MARRGKDLFERSILTARTVDNPSAEDILSGKVAWRNGRWEANTPTRKPRAVAKKAETKKSEPKGVDKEVEKVAANFKADYLPPSINKEIKEQILKKAKGETERDPSKFEDSLNGSKGGVQIAAYLQLKEAGKLPPSQHAKAEVIASNRDAAVALARDLTSRLTPRAAGIENKIMVDSQGRIVAVVKGNGNTVGGSPFTDDPIAQRDGYWSTYHSVNAGGGQVHNHPSGEYSHDKRTLGGGLSGGDVGSAVQSLHAFGLATAKEGTYVIRNTRWKQDQEAIQRRVEREVKAFKDQAVRQGLSQEVISLTERMVRRNAYDSGVRELTGKAQRVSDASTLAFTGTVSLLRSKGLLPAERGMGNWTPKQHALVNKIHFESMKAVLAKDGIELDFIPNQGYEGMLTAPDSVPD